MVPLLLRRVMRGWSLVLRLDGWRRKLGRRRGLKESLQFVVGENEILSAYLFPPSIGLSLLRVCDFNRER
jgi:hypothetical protein